MAKHSGSTSEEQQCSTSAKLLYRPVGLVGGVISGAIAGVIFKQIWKRVSPKSTGDHPKALESEFSLTELLAASALQGALFAVTKALVDRGGARVFQRLTGEWPGD